MFSNVAELGQWDNYIIDEVKDFKKSFLVYLYFHIVSL